MKKQACFASVIFVLAAVWVGSALAPPGKIIIVRHAEKLAGWPGGAAGAFQPLSEKGLKTAKRLAAFFKKGTVSAIYSSATTRTLHTAFQLAKKLGIQPEIAKACSDTSAIAAFYQTLHKNYGPDDTVVLVSHSNIVPYLLIKAGLPKTCFKKMAFTNWQGWLLTDYYGKLFVIENPGKKGKKCTDFKRISF